MRIHGWGRYPLGESNILLPKTQNDCIGYLQAHAELIPRGLGRSYGDSAMNSTVLQSTYLDHFIEFNEMLGVLTCESGISLKQIIDFTIPKGWFLPVTPGTSYVTLGGAIASDVHGKNHHVSGTISNHVLSFDLLIGSGEVIKVSETSHTDLFHATCGGMGLTGIILRASIQLKKIRSAQVVQTTLKAPCLEAVCEQLDENITSTYSVAWIDCLANKKNLGRSLLMLGEHVEDGPLDVPTSKQLNIPFEMPSTLLNKYSIKSFNTLYYNKEFRKNPASIMPLTSFFYPLDSMANWNRLYGRGGFIQYQFVIPKIAGSVGLKKILSVIVDSGKGSFLAVLKTFGKGNTNFLSFPIEGYTLALDFKMTPDLLLLIEKLDNIVLDFGGRIYLTKDAVLSEVFFKEMYPNWALFEQVREKYGAIGKFASQQSKRLGLQ